MTFRARFIHNFICVILSATLYQSIPAYENYWILLHLFGIVSIDFNLQFDITPLAKHKYIDRYTYITQYSDAFQELISTLRK